MRQKFYHFIINKEKRIDKNLGNTRKRENKPQNSQKRRKNQDKS